MKRYNSSVVKGKRVFVGIDLHRVCWFITVLLEGDLEMFSGSIPGRWEALEKLLQRYRDAGAISAVYEAGYFGFWLHDRLEAWGVACTVTPPSLILQEAGNRVKTDRRDSHKLAWLLAKGMLKRVWVPTEEQRSHRECVRHRRQLVSDRVRVQNRITAFLRFAGIEMPEARTKWSVQYVENLSRLHLQDPWAQASFQHRLQEYHFLQEQIKEQTHLVRELAKTDDYRERVAILTTVPGIGLIAAMELLVELQDVARFQRADQLAAYVGLTPAQYSSANKMRLGHITGAGKSTLRGTMVEVAWRLIAKDTGMRTVYERIKARCGAKRAIVAIARRLLLITRRMLLQQQTYRMRPAA